MISNFKSKLIAYILLIFWVGLECTVTILERRMRVFCILLCLCYGLSLSNILSQLFFLVFGIGCVIDLFLISRMVRQANLDV